MIVRLIILFGCLFTIGNIVWNKVDDWFPKLFPADEPKLMYVPLSIFLLLLVLNLRFSQRKIPSFIVVVFKWWKEESRVNIFLNYLLLLAVGNVSKQVFYSQSMKQINDYFFGGLVTIWLIVNLILCRTKQHYGKS